MGLSIIMGNMFSGKTSELIRRLKRLKIIGKKILVVNSAKDTRSPDEVLKTHDNVRFDCFKVYELFELVNNEEFNNADIIAIDEAQFFPRLKEFVEYCMCVNKDVIIAGLDGDSFQNEVTKLSALCMRCKDGTPGPFTKRIVKNQELELIGGSDMYIATCRRHL